MSDAPKPGPRLAALLASGDAWIESAEYVARASDGVVVSLGNLDRPADVDRYLTSRPTPDRW